MSFDLFKAFFLGVVEGLTEFLPVSSTGHLLLVQRFFGFDDEDFGKTFAVLIQFGAILALLSIYFGRIWQIALGMLNDPAARRFVIGVLIAFLPAAVVGALAHDFIKSVLFNVWIVCFTLIVGGAILLWVDRMSLNTRYHDATRFSLPMYFIIDLYKSRGQLSMDNAIIIAFGFVVSFVCAWIVVKSFLGYVQRHGFALFAWWRVIVGSLGLIALALGH